MSQLPKRKQPKQKGKVRLLAKAKETVVNWKRDVNDLNLPAHVKDHLDAVSIEHTQVRQQLDALRKTRGRRVVGSVKVPPALQQGMVLDTRERVRDPRTGKITLTDVERRADIPDILPAID